MKPYPFDSSQGDFKELVKEYTKDELFEIYASENTIPDVVMEYIFELEDELKKLRK